MNERSRSRVDRSGCSLGTLPPLLVLLAALAACGQGGGGSPADDASKDGGATPAGETAAGNNPPKPAEKKEPYTMKIYASGVAPEEFDQRFRGTLEAKFPHITFSYQTGGAGNTIQELVARGDIPDIIRTDVPSLKATYLDLKLDYDMRGLVEASKYDLNRFNSTFVQEIVSAAQSNALYGLPVPPYFPMVLYYNKDLFDRFGVPYPQDRMTWDEAYDLAKKMSRSENGEAYRGFSSNLIAIFRDNPYSVPILDPRKDELAEPEIWRKLFDNFKRFYEIPNNAPESNYTLENAVFSKGNVAMQANQHSIYLKLPPELNWDMVSLPTIPGGPKLMGQRGPAYWTITRQSAHKEEAFQVIAAMLDDEVQMADSRNGIPTTLSNPAIQAALGAAHPVYSTKNMNAVNVYPPSAPTPKRASGSPDVAGGTQSGYVWQEFLLVAQNQKDVNSALRAISEKLKQAVEAARNQ